MDQNPSKMSDTAELPALTKETSASAGVGRVRLDCAGRSDRGLVRKNNEDHFHIARFGRYLAPLATNVPGQTGTLFEEEGHGLVVADGMGGAAAGELASNLAIRTLLNLVIQTPDWILAVEGPDTDRAMKRMAERFQVIDQVLVQEASEHEELKGMGTTMTLACNLGSTMILAHIGDSRAYLFREGALHQLTRDHTLAQALVDKGYLKSASHATPQLQHTLIRVLGGPGNKADADVQRLTLIDQDIILLCSDGLTDMVKDEEIAIMLSQKRTADELADQLVRAALGNGGKDNVTAIVARYAFVNRPRGTGEEKE